MNLGIVGDWKNYFTEEQNAAFQEVYNKRMANNDLPITFEADHAFQIFSSHGRIIHNHPKRQERKTSKDITSDISYDTVEPFYKPDYPFMRQWIPSLSLHTQQDPLTLDAVG